MVYHLAFNSFQMKVGSQENWGRMEWGEGGTGGRDHASGSSLQRKSPNSDPALHSYSRSGQTYLRANPKSIIFICLASRFTHRIFSGCQEKETHQQGKQPSLTQIVLEPQLKIRRCSEKTSDPVLPSWLARVRIFFFFLPLIMWWMRLWGPCQPCLPQPGGGEPKRPAWEHSRCAGGGWRGLDICRPNVIKYEFSHCAGLSFLRIYEFQEKWPDTLRQTHCLCNMM